MDECMFDEFDELMVCLWGFSDKMRFNKEIQKLITTMGIDSQKIDRRIFFAKSLLPIIDETTFKAMMT